MEHNLEDRPFLKYCVPMNCDFYAAKDDLISILEFLFTETDLQVFELYSEYGKSLRQFRSTDELAKTFQLGKCENTARRIHLQLYSPSTKGKLIVKKIKLDPKECDGHNFRYCAEGLGLIQLYLGGASSKGKSLIPSHLGHLSKTRASTSEDFENWDWKVLSSISRKLANQVQKKIATKKLGSRAILPAAATLNDAGYSFSN